MRIGLVLILAMAVLCVPAFAQNTLTFAWDPHPQAIYLTGFNLYQTKTSGTYAGAPIATFTGGSTTTGTIQKPSSPGKWYWVLTAFMPDAESDYSNQVDTVIKPEKPNLRSVTLTALKAPVEGIIKLAGLFHGKKNLRIVKQGES
jgi:hypothetical protein